LDQKGVLKSGKVFIIGLLLAILLLALFALGAQNLYTVQVINTSTGARSAGGGFWVDSTNGKLVNGSSLNIGPAPLNSSMVNLSGIININISLLVDGSFNFSNVVNVTFTWTPTTRGQALGAVLNTTVFNFTARNQSGFNYSFNTALLTEGLYNISIYAWNVSIGLGDANGDNSSAVNYSRGQDIMIDRTAPFLTSAWFNSSNASNFSSSLVSILFFNTTVNDSLTTVTGVRFGFYNNNGTGVNISAFKDVAGVWTANVTASAMSDGLYTVIIFANDTLDNVNKTGNLTFTLDRTPPNVTSGTLTLGNISSLDTMGSLYGFNFSTNLAQQNYTINVVINDSTLTVQSVLFNVSSSVGRVTNFTGILNGSNYTAFNFNLSTLSDGWYNLTVVANDTVNNVNKSLYLPFIIDGTAPTALAGVWQNYSNATTFDNRITAFFNASSVSMIYFNATINDTTSTTQEVRFGFYNNINSTGFNVTGFKGVSGTWNANVSITNSSGGPLLIDGLYTVVLYANDTLNNANRTSNLTFYLDTSAPNVTLTANSPAGTNVTGANYSIRSSNVTFNVSVRDLVNVSSVYFVFENGTGTNFNVSAANTSGNWWVSYNVSVLAEGNQLVRIVTNDTLGNINTTVVYNLTVDRVNPVPAVSAGSISSTAATITTTVNESVGSCSYSGTQGIGDGNLTADAARTTYSVTFSSLASSTNFQVVVTCTDYAGNQATDTTSFGSTAASSSSSSGGGGAGGSSGGVSSSVENQFEKKIWSSINAGETATVEVKKGDVGVTEVSFTVPQTVFGAWVQVEKKDSLPSSVSKFDGKTYKALEISKGASLSKEGAFSEATVKFKVEKSWLADNKLTTESVALFHYVGGKWTQLQTQVGEDDGKFVHYSAKTPGFSYFVIGQSSANKAGAGLEAPAAEQTAPSPQAGEAAPSTGSSAASGKGLGMTSILLLLAGVVVVVALVLYLRKRK